MTATPASESRLRCRVRRRALGSLLALLLAALAGAGCQTPTSGGQEVSAASQQVWPEAPAKARIRYQAEIRGPIDLGIRSNLFRRFWSWISGRSAPRLVRPSGLSRDGAGRLWVTDPGAQQVHVFDVDRGRYLALPKRGDPPIVSPIAVVHDPRDIAYVSDSARGVIRRFDSDGESLEAWDAGGQLTRPTGLAFDPASNLLWVVDTGEHHLVALNAEGEIARTIGERGSAPGEFNFPTYLALTPAGQLLISDTLNFRVQLVETSGEVLATFGGLGDGPGALSKPKGVAMDGDGHVYVVDALFDNVQIFDEGGRLLLHFGDHGSAPGSFWLPAGLLMVDGRRLYVADSYNQRIQVFDYLGE